MEENYKATSRNGHELKDMFDFACQWLVLSTKRFGLSAMTLHSSFWHYHLSCCISDAACQGPASSMIAGTPPCCHISFLRNEIHCCTDCSIHLKDKDHLTVYPTYWSLDHTYPSTHVHYVRLLYNSLP